jgi:hypothetical protein
MPTVTPLVTRRGLSRELKIHYGDHLVVSPYTADILLVSRGRLDIPRSAFDGDQPLQLDVEAPIVEVLKVTTSPDRPIPPVKTDGSKLFVGPALIGHRETILISLLVEGDPNLGSLPQSLENVDIHRGDPGQARQNRNNRLSTVMNITVATLFAIVIIITALH